MVLINSGMLLTGLQIPTLPIPTIVNFKDLGLPAKAEDIFINASRGLQRNFKYIPVDVASDQINLTELLYIPVRTPRPQPQSGSIHPVLANQVAKMMQYGAKCVSTLWKTTWAALNKSSFGGVNFHRGVYEIKPVEVRLDPKKPFVDGDTAKIAQFKSGDGWVDFKVNVRMDGIDTPESNQSTKLTRHIECVTDYLRTTYGVETEDVPALQKLVEARIVYMGKIAGAMTLGFGGHFASTGIRLAPGYTLRADTAAMCDTLDLWDKYGRILGRIMAGGENQGEDLLAGFIETVMPQVMAQAKIDFYNGLNDDLNAEGELLERWRQENPGLHKVIGMSSVIDPTQAYSQAKCSELVTAWKEFVKEHPEAANDLQTLITFVGLGPVYPKYIGHRTELDLSAELIGLDAGYGNTRDPFYIFVRPNVKDKYASPVYKKYFAAMSDVQSIEELHPKSCHDKFGAAACRVRLR